MVSEQPIGRRVRARVDERETRNDGVRDATNTYR